MEDKSKVLASKRKSCMKHKKKDKKTSKDTKRNLEKNSDNKKGEKAKLTDADNREVQLPKDPSEYSANWKQLLQNKALQKEQKFAKKRKRQNSAGEDTPPKAAAPEKKAKPSAPEIWFDGVDEILLQGFTNNDEEEEEIKTLPTKPAEKNHENTKEEKDRNASTNALVKPQSFSGPTKILAMDCEMVGVGDSGEESILARVSIVNQYGQCVYDTFVRPTEDVTDYRTAVSGVRKHDMEQGEEFSAVQKKVGELIDKRILVGHAIENDLKVLFLTHPRKMIRDTQRYAPFKALFNGRRPALRKLSEQVLKVTIQKGEHSSIQDAQATMRLYTMYRQQWEKDIKLHHQAAMQPAKKKKKKTIT